MPRFVVTATFECYTNDEAQAETDVWTVLERATEQDGIASARVIEVDGPLDPKHIGGLTDGGPIDA